MKHILSLLMVLALSANAFGQNEAQVLKAKGWTPGVTLAEAAANQLDAEQTTLGQQLQKADCGFPDFPDAEIGALDPADDDDLTLLSDSLGYEAEYCKSLILAHKRWLEGVGSGSYPHSCNADHPGVHVIYQYINRDTFGDHLKRPLTDDEFQTIIDAKVWGPTGDHNGCPFAMAELKAEWGGKEMLDVVIDFGVETYRRTGVVVLVREIHGDQHNIHSLSRFISGGVIGIGWFPSSAPCPGDHVEFHIDNSYKSGFQGQLSLWVHEMGHTFKLPHQFSNERSHQEPMSYNYRGHLVNGYSTGDPVFDLPRAPSMSLLTRYYGGEPVGKPWGGRFEGTPPPPDPPTGDAPVEVGDEIVQTQGGWKITLEVVTVEGDEGPTLAKRIAEALANVPDYPRKDRDRQAIAAFYQAVAVGVQDGAFTIEQGKQAIAQMLPMVLGNNLEKWTELLAIAATVDTVEGMLSVSNGLLANEALPPELIGIIKILVQFLPEDIRSVVTIILAILEGLDAHEAVEAEPKSVLKAGHYVPRRRQTVWRRRQPFLVSQAVSV